MKKGYHMTREQAEAHQAKHGFVGTFVNAVDLLESRIIPKPRMNKTETEYSLILEAMKRRGEILRWEFEGMTLSWGADPKTKKPMRYTPDFVVFQLMLGPPITEQKGCKWVEPHINFIEVKGAHIRSRDLVRFKGCRSDWPEFQFEMHQKKGGQWTRIH